MRGPTSRALGNWVLSFTLSLIVVSSLVDAAERLQLADSSHAVPVALCAALLVMGVVVAGDH